MTTSYDDSDEPVEFSRDDFNRLQPDSLEAMLSAVDDVEIVVPEADLVPVDIGDLCAGDVGSFGESGVALAVSSQEAFVCGLTVPIDEIAAQSSFRGWRRSRDWSVPSVRLVIL